MKNKGGKILFEFLLFLMLLLFVFTRVTYLYREVSISRYNVTGLKNEENLDVVCIGASTVLMYYQPLVAWEKYGYTSYDYATVYGPIEFYKYYMDKVLKAGNPKLYVVDLRALTCTTDDVLESGVRYWTDSLPVFSPVRWLSIHKYMQTHPKPDDLTAYYFDIAKYHSKEQALSSPENWTNINNNGPASYKGHELSSVHRFFEEPAVSTKEKGELSIEQSDILHGLLEYCRKKELNVLFVVCPYLINEEEKKIYNTAEELITSYGYSFIDTNEYYSEMNIDFATDFKDKNHVNCIGAEKYTEFLADYIAQNYEIPDHRDDIDYAKWNSDSAEFRQDLENCKKEVLLEVAGKYEAVNLAEEMVMQDDPFQWTADMHNPNFTAVMCANLEQCSLENMNAQSGQLMKNLGINDNEGKYFQQVSCGDEILYREDTAESIDYYGTMGSGFAQANYEVHVDENIRLIIDKKDYALGNDGINILVFDNNFGKVVDHVILRIGNDGAVYMERE